MKQLFKIDLRDYNENYCRFKRPSVRAVIISDKKLAMVYSKKYDYYKFPGGGIESNEDHITALKREVLEETGLTILDSSVKELGSVLRIQKSSFAERTIFEQQNFYYLCDVDDTLDLQSLDDYESDEGFTLNFVSASDAVMTNKSHSHGDYDLILIERETRVIEYLVENNYL